MTAFLSLSFTSAGAVSTGTSAPEVRPSGVPVTALASPVQPPGFDAALTHGWTPTGGDGLALTVDAPFFGEFALELVLVGVDATTALGLQGAGSPAALSLAPSGAGGALLLSAVVPTSSGPVALSAPVVPPAPGEVCVPAVWGAGSEVVLVWGGMPVARRRFTGSLADPAGDVVIGGGTAAGTAMIAGVRLRDSLTTDEDAAFAAAGAQGLGEIDSLVLSGAEGYLGAPTAAETVSGRLRWRPFENGVVYWSAATGAHAVKGDFLTGHNNRGGPAGRLGLPTTAELGLAQLAALLRLPRAKGFRGLRLSDVVTKAGALSADDLVLDAREAPAKPTGPGPRVKGTWESFRRRGDELDLGVFTGTDAGAVVSIAGGAPDEGAILRAAAVLRASGVATAAEGTASPLRDLLDAPAAEAAALSAQLDQVYAQSFIETAGGRAFGRIAAQEGVFLRRGGRGEDLPGVLRRHGQAGARRQRRGVDEPIPVDEPTPDAAAAAAAGVQDRVLSSVREGLAGGTMSVLEASVLAPSALLDVPALTAALSPGAEWDTVTLTDAAPDFLALVEESSRLGVEVKVISDGAKYAIRGPRAQMFQNGLLLHTGSGSGGIMDLYDEILAHWLLLGAADGFLGLPRYSQTSIVGGAYAEFAGGRIYWSAATGAHEVHGAILERALRNFPTGATPWGFPTSDESDVQGHAGARVSFFEYGAVYWRGDIGAVAISGDFLAHWTTNGGIGRYGMPTSEVQSGGGRGLEWQPFTAGVLARTPQTGIFEQFQASITRVSAQNIDDGVEFTPLPRSDTTAELFVKGWVWVDGVEVLSRQSPRQTTAVDLDWTTAPFTLRPDTTVRVRIEAYDYDSLSKNDHLATLDRTWTYGDGFWGFADTFGPHLEEGPTEWTPSNADQGDVKFSYAITLPSTKDQARMREQHFWRFRNAGRDHLPWTMYKETFVDIDGDDVNYFTDPFDSWYYDAEYEDVADGGNCFGFSVSAQRAFNGLGQIPQPLSLQTSDQRDDGVWRVINRAQGTQKASSVVLWKIAAKLSADYCDPRNVWSRVKSSTDRGLPVILSFRKKDAGHAVLVYHCDQQPDGIRRMYIADSNVPWTAGSTNDASMFEVHPDGSYTIKPDGMYDDWEAGRWERGSIGERYMMDIPEQTVMSPLRTPNFDMVTQLACLVGGIMTSDGAAISQVESGGRKLVGDQRRELLDEWRGQAVLSAAAARAGIAEKREPDAAASENPWIDVLRGQERLAAQASLLTGLVSGQALDIERATTALQSAAVLPGWATAKDSWGPIAFEAGDWADQLETDLRLRPSIDLDTIITVGALPHAAFIHAEDDRVGGPDVVAFRGPVPDDLRVTLRGRGGQYRHAIVARGGLVRLSSALASGTVDTVTALRMAGDRPSLSMTTSGLEKTVSASLSVASAAGSLGWTLPLGVASGVQAEVRWMPGRPGIAVRHGAAVAEGEFRWNTTSEAVYAAPAAQAGETVRIVPADAASPLGAMRLQRESVLGDLIASEVIDPR
ncbi:hypothetical protein [Microbacterium sp. SSM24]|uniref:hypothetical protein n=1 Tax=Microbacterium sp. SSM24 TaxID=2991714 RepID=UPI00222686C7|nr:hypothetical protein [Microbacterium sp. SSM24]MCW3493008.1 hypothetical protein [Microbacterium sp. SSM24]